MAKEALKQQTDEAKVGLEEQEAALAQREARIKAWEERLAKREAEFEAGESKRKQAGADERPEHSAEHVTRPVVIKLFKDGQRYSEPLYVNINSRNFLIPRGVPVTVPYYVARHLEEMNAQDENTARLISMYEQEYERNKNMLN